MRDTLHLVEHHLKLPCYVIAVNNAGEVCGTGKARARKWERRVRLSSQ